MRRSVRIRIVGLRVGGEQAGRRVGGKNIGLIRLIGHIGLIIKLGISRVF